MASHLSRKIDQAFEVLGRTPSKPGELDGTLEHIACTAQEFLESDVCTVSVFNPITRGFISSRTAGQSLHAEKVQEPDKEEIERSIQYVQETGIFIANNEEEIYSYRNVFIEQEDIHAFVSLALSTRHRKRLLGIITFYFRQSSAFSESDLEKFRIYARASSFLLQATWQERHYEEVARIGQNINHNLSTPEDLFQELQTYVENILDESHTLLLAVYHQQTGLMDFYREEPGGRSITRNRPMSGASQYIITTQESIYIKRLSQERENLPYEIIRVPGTDLKESLIFVPVTLRGVSLGVLSVQHTSPNSYGQNDLFILKLLATHIALALHNMRLYNNLSELNEMGRSLTRQPDSEQTPSITARNILDATRADSVVLYPYDAKRQQFILPPIVVGSVQEASVHSMLFSQPLLAELVLHNDKAIFAKESVDAYKLSGAKIGEDNFQRREQIASVAAIPLKDRDEPVGVLFVNFHRSQHFDAAQKLLIEGLASFAAIAIRNAHIYGSLNLRRATELDTLQNIDRELNRILELEPVLNTILQAANQLLKAEHASIMLYNSRTSTLKTAAVLGIHVNGRWSTGIHTRDARGITWWVLNQKQSALVKNVNDQAWQDIYVPSSDDTVSELDVPLLDGEEAIGVLNFESTREGAFSEEDKAFLLNLAGQTVLAIKNAQSYERERRLADERRILNEISKEITRQFDPVEVFKLILDKALELTHSAYGTLWLYDPDQDDLWMAAERGSGGERLERMSLDQGVVGYVARKKQRLNVDPTASPWNKIYLPFLPGTRSELTVAMLARDDLRGVLNIESAIPNNFDEGYERLMVGLSDLAVIALQNAERYQETQREARRFELLYQIEQELGKLTELANLDAAYDTIIGLVEKSEQCRVSMYRYSDVSRNLTLINTSLRSDDPFLHVNIDEAIHAQVMEERRMLVIYDTATPSPDVTYTKRESVTRHSLVIAPIMFSDKYYGNLEISHENVGYLRATNIHFLERLTQQLSSTIANTIYRLEIAEERQESEKRALSAEEMSSIGQLAYELTHRVGNDLGLVESYVNDIRAVLEVEKFTSGFIMGKLEKIVRSARRVLDLSRDLKHEMIKTGNAMADKPTVIHPNDLFNDVIEEFKDRLAQHPGIQIEIDNAQDVGSVRVLRSSILDLFHNLILNAIEAMPAGGKLTLHAYNSGAFVLLAVSDTGIGISPEKQSKVFDLSFSTKGSSGFGLWSALRNARRNYGKLSVVSQTGQGTTFTLFLPQINEQIIQST
jgi:GAF domain-containing protein